MQTIQTSAKPAAVTSKQYRATARNIVIASMGNAMEWFDFIVYGFFATVIAKVFFPTGDDFTSLLLTTASFGVPFIMRPIGAIWIGRYADRAGRKPALTLTVGLMLLGTLIIALTPSFASIGMAAPILVVLARIIQGVSAGGEYGSAATYLAEQNPARRGFYGSWQFASQGAASLLAAAIAWWVFSAFTPAEIEAWAWRIPFYCGLLIGPIGIAMRRSMRESDEFIEVKKAPSHVPTVQGQGMRELMHRVLIAAGLVTGATVSAYVMVLYLPTFAIRQLHLQQVTAFASTTVSGIVALIVTPMAGAASDRFGRAGVMRLGLILVGLAIFPLFVLLLSQPSLGTLLLCQLVAGLLMSLYNGPLVALMAEIFSTRERTFGISLGYNIAVTLFGGFAPMILTLLINVTQSNTAPAWYVLLAVLISFWSVSAAAKRPH